MWTAIIIVACVIAVAAVYWIYKMGKAFDIWP